MFHAAEVETTALNDVDLGIAAGEFIAIMGPSGCGKSTLLNIIGMLDNPSNGRYLFHGEDVVQISASASSPSCASGTSASFSRASTSSTSSRVFENVELPLVYQRLPRARARKRACDAVLERIGISARRDHLPQQLSGGQQQRVAVARAVVVRRRS